MRKSPTLTISRIKETDNMAPIAERVKVFFLVCGLVLFIPLGIVAKQSMATTFILVASVLIVTTFFLSPKKLIPNKSIVYGFSVFCLYACIIHFVTVECIPCKSLLLTKISMLGLVLWVTSLDLSRLDCFPQSKISWTLNISLFVASIFLIIEFLNDALLYRWLSDRINDPEVALSRYNRVTSALVLFVWPVSYWAYQRGNKVVAISLIIVTFCAALLSHSNSALVVSVLVPIIAILGYFLPTFVFWSGFFSLSIFALSSPFIFVSLLNWIKPFSNSIPPSTLDRIEIWHRSAVAVFEAPWFGYGIGITRYLPLQQELTEKYKYHVTPTTHPHNAAIQLWLELGVIGLSIFLLLLCFAVQPLKRVPSSCLGIALAVAVGVIFTSLVSFGFWQETWLGIIGLVVICFKVVIQYSNKKYS